MFGTPPWVYDLHTYRVVKNAEDDTEDLRFDREAAGLIRTLTEKDALPKKDVPAGA